MAYEILYLKAYAIFRVKRPVFFLRQEMVSGSNAETVTKRFLLQQVLMPRISWS